MHGFVHALGVVAKAGGAEYRCVCKIVWNFWGGAGRLGYGNSVVFP